VGLVVEPDRDDLLRLARVEEPHVGEGVSLPAGGRDRLPGLVARVEAAEAGGTRVDDLTVLEPAQARYPVPGGEADGLHTPCSSRRTVIALTARGTPAY